MSSTSVHTERRTAPDADARHPNFIRCVPKEGDALPALLVVPSIFGLADDLVETMEGFAAEGTVVMGIDPFWRIAPGPLPYEHLEAALERSRKCTVDEVLADTLWAIDQLRSDPRTHGRVAGLGICFGGRYCILAAAHRKLNGFVNWHGGGLEDLLRHRETIEGPAWLHFAKGDPFVPDTQVERVRAAWADRPETHIIVHSGVQHGFSHAGPAYDPDAAASARRSVTALLGRLRTER